MSRNLAVFQRLCVNDLKNESVWTKILYGNRVKTEASFCIKSKYRSKPKFSGTVNPVDKRGIM